MDNIMDEIMNEEGETEESYKISDMVRYESPNSWCRVYCKVSHA